MTHLPAIPTLAQARQYLEQAEKLNPGPWVSHSLFVAQGAQLIAERHPRLDSERAYVLGCLHDIGRRFGVHGIRHVLDGYQFLMDEGYSGAARVCLTHAYPVKGLMEGVMPWDGSEAGFETVRAFLANIEYDDYDRLIQLCDALALPTGFCLVEKRLVEVALRYGVDGNTTARWRGYLGILHEMDHAIGMPVYRLLPGVVEITFGWAGAVQAGSQGG